MGFKTNMAIKAANLSKFVLQNVMNRPGAFYPGKIALNIDKNLIEELSGQFDMGNVLITGTNGKTSVTNMMADCMNYQGVEVAWNKTGANLASGIVSAMLDFSPKRRKSKVGIFEIDELWVEKVLPQTKSKYLLLLNLFPDQVDRFGGVDNIQKSLVNALNSSPETVLIYNSDDPNCQIVADDCGNNTIPFGVDDKISNNQEITEQKCPLCSFNMRYKLHQYEKLGIYRCPNCGFNRANPKFAAKFINLTPESLSFSVNGKNYISKKAVEYAVYNLTAFIALASMMECHEDSIVKSIKFQQSAKGRMEYFELEDKRIMINLAKNPVGFNQNIDYILNRYRSSQRPGKTAVAFFANAREGDGKDTNWINQVNFNMLSGLDMLDVYYGGEAAEDLAVALMNANIIAHKVDTASEILQNDSHAKKIYIIANYTALSPLREEIASMAK